MNYIVDQLALHLVNNCFDNTLLILYRSLLCSVKIEKIHNSKVPKIWLVKFCIFNFKIVYFTQFSMDFSYRDVKTKV